MRARDRNRRRGRGARRVLVLGAAALALGSVQAHDGARLYEQRCLSCHSHDEICRKLDCLGDDEAVRKRLAALLPVHHVRDAEERQAITDYVIELRKKRKP